MPLDALRRQDGFSFACARCGRCCHGQAIQLNGYEIARLAQGLGLCTTETIAKYTTEKGQFLRFNDDGACVFLRQEGCAAHAHRPLACRLYPLGREGGGEGGELFARLDRHPLCAGQNGALGTVAQYLEEQGAGPFLRAFDLYQRAALRFLGLPAQARPEAAARIEWFNLDWALAQGGLDVLPADPWRKMELHLEWLAGIMDQAQAWL